MQASECVLGEARGNRTRVVAVDRRLVVATLRESYDSAVEQVDGGNELEGEDGGLAFGYVSRRFGRYSASASDCAIASAPRRAISFAVNQCFSISTSCMSLPDFSCGGGWV